MIVDDMRICPLCADVRRVTECPFCKISMIKMDIHADAWCSMSKEQKDEKVKHYIETTIKDTYDPEISKKQKEWWAKEAEETEKLLSAPRCPYCKSRFITKVTFFDRLLDTTVWGLASDLIGKTHKCVNCDATW